MARMIPARTEFASPAEKVLYHAFREQLPDDYRVLHSVAWYSLDGEVKGDGEADFVIAHPRHGVLVIEVKGGGISRDGMTGRWNSVSRDGTEHEIKDPFGQTSRNVYALRAKLSQSPATAGHTYRMARSVAFPDILLDGADLGPGAPRAMVIDSRDIPTIARALHRAWENAPGPPSSAAAIDALVSVLRPTVELRRPGLAAAMRYESDEMIQLTNEQVRALKLISNHRRAAFTGTAGSGKTLLAIATACRLAREGFRVLYTCYTKALAAWVAEQVRQELGQIAHLVTVDNVHDLAVELVRQTGGPTPDGLEGEQLNRYFAVELPDHALAALGQSSTRFDAIVVDEGQDFSDLWWIAIEAMLAQPHGPFYIFYDASQSIFRLGDAGNYPIPEPHYPLSVNCRTTRQIHAAAQRYRGCNPMTAECEGPEGRPIVSIPTASGAELRSLQQAVHTLVKEEGIPLDEIVVLSPRNARTSRLVEGAPVGNATLTWNGGGPNTLRCRTIQAFKGLEAPVVIIAEPDRVHPDTADAVLHVALTRAKHHVIVLGELPAPTCHR